MENLYRKSPERRFSVAPMMERTDRHCRFFMRLISRHTLLYTEMVTAAAVVSGNRDRLLACNPQEHPVALQLGGSDPQLLAEAVRVATDYGYDEINFNAGCPSDRVRSGRFGACLMREPDLAARCVEAMCLATPLPVTVKCRIGVDEQDPVSSLPAFLQAVTGTGCDSVAIHARKAWLQGLSPKENRTVPPLDYDLVYQMKDVFPALEIVINGGVRSLDEVQAHLDRVDGVMMGRMAYEQPYILAQVDHRFFGAGGCVVSRAAIVERFLPYMEEQLAQGIALTAMTRHILGLYRGVAGGRHWRRYLSENISRHGAGLRVVEDAMAYVEGQDVSAGAGA